jgi:hypothetical protein
MDPSFADFLAQNLHPQARERAGQNASEHQKML